MGLNSNQVKSKKAGAHADGGGLYLVVRDSGERVWAFRFTGLDGKRAQMEFAKAGDRDSEAGAVLTLSSARDKAREYKVALKRGGVDPRIKKRVTAQGGKTFKEFAEEQYPLWCKGLSAEEEKQWKRSIRDVPKLHNVKLHGITTENLLEALKPIWTVKPVTASESGLPTSASTVLPAGTPVTADVTVKNSGDVPEEYFVDARLNTTTTLNLAPQTTSTLQLPNLFGAPQSGFSVWVSNGPIDSRRNHDECGGDTSLPTQPSQGT